MFKNFWYAVCREEEVRQKPLSITLFGFPIAIYSDSRGKYAALNDRCPHRGSALSLGRVKDGCLVCPYHGWTFNQSGACTHIPANSADSANMSRFDTGYLPARARYGFVFVFVGDAGREDEFPIPEIPECEDLSNWGVIYGDSLWRTHATRSIENLLDFSHTAIVHKSFGNPERPSVPGYRTDRSETSVSASVSFFPPMNMVQYILRRGRNSEVRATATFYMPNVTRLDIEIGGWRMIVVAFHHEIDSQTTVMHWVQLRDFFKPVWLNWDARRRIIEVIEEDRPIVESQRPSQVPLDLAEEQHVPSDGLHIAYRRMISDFAARGYLLNGPLGFRKT